MAIVTNIVTAFKNLKTTMDNAIAKFKGWLVDRRNFLFSRYTKDGGETQEPERSLIELPSEIGQKLVNAVENLPNNPADCKAISAEIDKAFDSWVKDPSNANNSIAILNSPIVPVSRILSSTLAEWTKSKDAALNLFSIKARPDAIESITSKLEHHLKSQSQERKEREVIVIPNLNWCFLRSLEGLDGIECLQSLLCEDSHRRFWIIGSGQVGWQYLKSVCSLDAYCGVVFNLPAIASEDLQTWLEPAIEELQITFDKPRIDKQILDRDKDDKTNYFERLADISQGVSTVAIQAFLKSICYGAEEKEGEENSRKHLVAKTPTLPKLPDLESADRYILYSLLLHGDLTMAALAQSLGDMESEVQPRIQLLRRVGIVEQQERVLKINPLYYPRVKQSLASNNFIVNRK